MAVWWAISLQLCLFGFLKELRPSESYVTQFMIGPAKNFTLDQVIHEIFPVSTYSCLAQLVFVFLLTDYLRYKAVIILEGAAYVIAFNLLTFANGVHIMQLMEFFYALALSTEVAYYTYIYAKVDKKHYQQVTTHTYTALLIGRCMAALLAQVLVSTDSMSYLELNYITIGCVSAAFVVAITLPSVETSIYFHRKPNIVPTEQRTEEITKTETSFKPTSSTGLVTETEKKCCKRLQEVVLYMWSDFCSAYVNPYVLKWSIWWACATCLFLQSWNYVQSLWEEIQPGGADYNGGVDFIHTLLSAIATYSLGYIRLNWEVAADTIITITSFLQGGVLIAMGMTSELWVSYVCYIIFRITYQVLLATASAEVAKNIREDSHGVVFGINTFMSLALQTILTIIIADQNGLALGPRIQFVIYGVMYGIIGVIFFCKAVYVCVRYNGCNGKIWLPQDAGDQSIVMSSNQSTEINHIENGIANKIMANDKILDEDT